MPEIVHFDKALRLMKTALMSPTVERPAPNSVIWKTHGDCEEPFIRVVVGRPSAETTPMWTWRPGLRSTLTVEQWLRCNQCIPCLKSRARMWRARMLYEIDNAPRSWFGTLTLNPARMFHTELMARQEWRDYDHLPLDRQRKKRLAVAGSEVTRYMKRVRKAATAPIRFVCVTETSSKGERDFHPHYHLFIHEQTRGCLKHEILAKQWNWGFEKWRLIEPGAKPVWYLTKYLSKSNDDRVRASLLYGGRTKDVTD